MSVLISPSKSLISSRWVTYLKKHTAPRAYSKHAPGAVCISNMVLEHIWPRKFFQIINGLGPYRPYVKAKISKKPSEQQSGELVWKQYLYNIGWQWGLYENILHAS